MIAVRPKNEPTLTNLYTCIVAVDRGSNRRNPHHNDAAISFRLLGKVDSTLRGAFHDFSTLIIGRCDRKTHRAPEATSEERPAAWSREPREP
jgi:hypothetical protein